jgi:hypothetical protein
MEEVEVNVHDRILRFFSCAEPFFFFLNYKIATVRMLVDHPWLFPHAPKLWTKASPYFTNSDAAQSNKP